MIYMKNNSYRKPIIFIQSFGLASLLVGVALITGSPNANAQSSKFEFGVLGDTQYSLKTEPELPKMIAQMNQNEQKRKI